MKRTLGATVALVVASPLLMAPTAVTGTLAGFSRGSEGQTPASWGLPSGGTSQDRQGPQSSGSTRGQSSVQSPGGGHDGQSSTQHARPGAQGTGQTPGGDAVDPMTRLRSGDPTARVRSGSDSSGSRSGGGATSGDSSNGSGTQGPRGGETDPQGRRGGDTGPQDRRSRDSDPQDPRSRDTDPQSDSARADPPRPSQDPVSPTDGANPQPDRGDPTDPQSRRGDPTDPQSRRGDPTGAQSEYEPLDPGDRQYDPSDMPDLDRRIPSSCAEPGSRCYQCMRSAEENIQFNRRYLHVAWSVTHAHLEYADRMMKIGDTGSNFHGAMALSWQLGGKPQIISAVRDLKATYDRKYRDYLDNIKRSVRKLQQCEQDNAADQDLYRRFSELYLDMIQLRYESPDP